MAKTDLTEFHVLTKRRASWDERSRKIKERFPSVENLDWNEAFRQDLDLFARVLRDILKLEQATPGRPGPRPSLDVKEATRRLQQFLGRDYTIEAFPEALRVLAYDLSIRRLATKVGLNRNHVHRLLTGETDPDAYAMEQIARAFKKSPSYFLEYRQLYITQALMSRLEFSPEATVGLYVKLSRAADRA